MTDLIKLRQKINHLDQQLIPLLEQRFEVVKQVGEYKRLNDLEVLDTNREQQVLQAVATKACRQELVPYLQAIYQAMMDQAKKYEEEL